MIQSATRELPQTAEMARVHITVWRSAARAEGRTVIQSYKTRSIRAKLRASRPRSAAAPCYTYAYGKVASPFNLVCQLCELQKNDSAVESPYNAITKHSNAPPKYPIHLPRTYVPFSSMTTCLNTIHFPGKALFWWIFSIGPLP